MVALAQLRSLALALPVSEEGTSYGTIAFKVRGKLFARLRDDDTVLALRVEEGTKEALVQGADETFFTTPHYDGYPYVLIRLATVDPAELAELLAEGWRQRAPARLVAAIDAGQAREGG